MNREYYSNIDFSKLKRRINREIERRGTFKYWDPLTTPSVGTDRTPPLNLPEIGTRVQVGEKTYTINNPSEGSIEPTRNIKYPAHGENPAGQNPSTDPRVNVPDTSAAELNVDELKNYLVGLAKINDINLFYGRDEVEYLAFRDPQGIEDVVDAAAASKLNAFLHESNIEATRTDPLTGETVTYPQENGIYVMPSGEYDGEELKEYKGLGPENFYDDYGAEPGDSNYHPYNPYVSRVVRRDWYDQDHDRHEVHTIRQEGGVSSTRFGTNPRNPNQGSEYRSRPVYGGKKGSCVGACTGLCYVTCDNECSESCTSTCWGRCGNACTNSCQNVCTGCSSQCFNTCKTKCENITGYSCVKSGAKTVSISTTGGSKGVEASNTLTYTTTSCNGCQYSCMYYPNKKTECWDSGCLGKCFISCMSACSTSCYGGCINNASVKGDGYKSGKGTGCSAGCTMNCIGFCEGVCAGYCVQTCFNTCTSSCMDNCTWSCVTQCGDGCATGCTNGCTGCYQTCTGDCKTASTSRTCVGCGMYGGCTNTCQFDCDYNCMSWGCRAVCGTESTTACDANCRLSCMEMSCTSMCSNACSDLCTTCVNSCDMQCGACSSMCSTGCESACNISCTESCSNSCSENCVHSCTETCGSCSSLCYSCVGMCIGVCSVTCESGCSSCDNQCGYWCDSTCNRDCLSDCSSYCISTCIGSCSTYLSSETLFTTGPERPPIADGYIYPNPVNRWEERESFKLIQDIAPYRRAKTVSDATIVVTMISNQYWIIIELPLGYTSQCIERVKKVSERDNVLETNLTSVDVSKIEHIWRYGGGAYLDVHLRHVFVDEFVYLHDTTTLGAFDHDDVSYLTTDKNVIVSGPSTLNYVIYETSMSGGVWNVDETTGEITVNEDMLGDCISGTTLNADGGGGIFIIRFYKDDTLFTSIDDIEFILPFGYTTVGSTNDSDGNLIVIIERDEFLYPQTRS